MILPSFRSCSITEVLVGKLDNALYNLYCVSFEVYHFANFIAASLFLLYGDTPIASANGTVAVAFLSFPGNTIGITWSTTFDFSLSLTLITLDDGPTMNAHSPFFNLSNAPEAVLLAGSDNPGRFILSKIVRASNVASSFNVLSSLNTLPFLV